MLVHQRVIEALEAAPAKPALEVFFPDSNSSLESGVPNPA